MAEGKRSLDFGLLRSNADIAFELGDLGIFIGTFKTPDLNLAKKHFISNGQELVFEGSTPENRDTFYVKDPNGLLLQVLKILMMIKKLNRSSNLSLKCLKMKLKNLKA